MHAGRSLNEAWISALLLGLSVALFAIPAVARDAVEVCPVCDGKRMTEIERDVSWPKAARKHEELGLWCSWCEALGVYDKELRVGPCIQCGLFPSPTVNPENFPMVRREELKTAIAYWWKDHPSQRVVFLTTQTMTLSSQLESMELNVKEFKDYLPERMRVAEHCPGSEPKKNRIISKHERAHIYMQRAIDAYELCNETVGVKTKEESQYYKITVPRIDFLLFNSTGEVDQFSAKHGGSGIYLGTQIRPVGSTGNTANADDLLWGTFIHNLAHHWCDRIYGAPREREAQGWLFNGIANHVEMVIFGEPRNKCDTEFNKGMQWSTSRWRTKVHKGISDNEIQLQDVMTKSKESQNFMEHLVSWSLIDFLSAYSKPKFSKLIAGLVQSKPLAEALRESHGWTTNMLEVNWIRYVQANYANEPKQVKPR